MQDTPPQYCGNPEFQTPLHRTIIIVTTCSEACMPHTTCALVSCESIENPTSTSGTPSRAHSWAFQDVLPYSTRITHIPFPGSGGRISRPWPPPRRLSCPRHSTSTTNLKHYRLVCKGTSAFIGYRLYTSIHQPICTCIRFQLQTRCDTNISTSQRGLIHRFTLQWYFV